MLKTCPFERACLRSALLIAILSALLAMALLPRVLRSRIDVGLDTFQALPAAPHLAWGEQQVVMQRITGPCAPAEPVARYHAFIPRKALAGAALRIPRLGVAVVRRLYVGSLVPEVYAQGMPVSTRPFEFRREVGPPATDGNDLVIRVHSPLERSRVSGFLCLWGVILVFLAMAWIAIRLAVWLLRGAAAQPAPDGALAPRLPLRTLLLMAALPVAAWLAYFALSFPAAMSSDSVRQWAEGHAMVFDDYYAPFHSLYLRAAALLGDSPASVALLQIAYLAASLVFGYQLLLRAGVPRAAVVTALLASAFSPRNGNMSIILWKDVPYSAAMFLVAVLLARYLLDASCAKRARYWLALGVLLGLVPLFRHNGLVVFAGLLVVLPFFFRPYLKRFLAAAAAAILLLGAWKAGIQPALRLNVPAPLGTRMTVWYLTYRASFLVEEDVPLAQDECDLLAKIRPRFNDGWGYDTYSMVHVMNDPSFNYAYALEHAGRLRSMMASLARRYPLLLLKNHVACQAQLYWPFQPRHEVCEGPWLTIFRNDLGLAQRPLSWRGHVWLNRLVAWTNHPRLNWLFWRPALHLYLAIAAIGILVARTRDARWAVVLLPFLVNTLSIFLMAMSQEKRFQYPLCLATGFLLCLAFLPVRKGTRG